MQVYTLAYLQTFALFFRLHMPNVAFSHRFSCVLVCIDVSRLYIMSKY